VEQTLILSIVRIQSKHGGNVDDFSVELAAERINDSRTREYFQEIQYSFVSGSHRSAIVMLWSVVVADLVYKLQDLRDLYGDVTAKSILEAVEAKQLKNPNNPEWEVQLVEDINSRLNLFEPAEYQHLLQLQKLRNLSAHPILSATNVLFSPNRETVRAAIRNALEGVLLKPPIFSKKIVSEFAADLAAKKALLPDRASLASYLEAKYFKGLHPEVEREIFKALWKFVFRLENPETDENRDVNVRTLHLLYERKPLELKEFIQSQQTFFSELADGAPIAEAIRFLSAHPSLYGALSDAAKVLIENRAKSTVDLYSIAMFLSPDFSKHIEALLQLPQRTTISAPVFKEMMITSRNAECSERLCILGSEIYGSSPSFNTADFNFTNFIEPYLDDFDSEAMKTLLEQIEGNSQTYGRGRASIDHPKVYLRCQQVLGASFDYTKYVDFNKTLKPKVF
jgi:hypothetical protein